MTADEVRALLRNELANLYPDKDDAIRIVTDAGLDVRRIDFSGPALNTWNRILHEAEKVGRADALLNAALNEYGANPSFRNAWLRYHVLYAAEPSKSRALEAELVRVTEQLRQLRQEEGFKAERVSELETQLSQATEKLNLLQAEKDAETNHALELETELALATEQLKQLRTEKVTERKYASVPGMESKQAEDQSARSDVKSADRGGDQDKIAAILEEIIESSRRISSKTFVALLVLALAAMVIGIWVVASQGIQSGIGITWVLLVAAAAAIALLIAYYQVLTFKESRKTIRNIRRARLDENACAELDSLVRTQKDINAAVRRAALVEIALSLG